MKMSKQTSTKNGGVNVTEYKGSPPPAQIVKSNTEIVAGKLYVQMNEVWAIDFQQSATHMQVYIKEQIFKVEAGNLVFLDGKKDEH
jgi:hypothetical protein